MSDIKRLESLNGAKPKLATPHDLESGGLLSGTTYIKKRSSKKEGKITVKAVADALALEGLDTKEELITIITNGSLEPKHKDSVVNRI